MHRYKYICMDIVLIHTDIGGYIPDINRYAQICTDMHMFDDVSAPCTISMHFSLHALSVHVWICTDMHGYVQI